MIHTELCWVVREDEQAASRAAIYRAPTWSWASIDGAVVPVVSYSGRGTQAKHEIRSEIDLVNVDISLADNGLMLSAPIFLYGRLRPARLTRIGGARAPSVFRIANDDANCESNSKAKGSGTIYLDPRPLEGEGSEHALINNNDDGGISPPPPPPQTTENNKSTTHKYQEQQQQQQQQQSITYQLLHISTRKWRIPNNNNNNNNDDNDHPTPKTHTLLYEVLALEPIKDHRSGEAGNFGEEYVRVGAGEITFENWFEGDLPLRRICIF